MTARAAATFTISDEPPAALRGLPATAAPASTTVEAGIMVHRALQAGVALGARSRVQLRRSMAALLRPEERALVEDVETALDRAVELFTAIDPDSLPPGRVHEVPFSLRRSDGTIVRGAIDALVEHPDGRIEVLEFKTGRPLPQHERQLALYLEAARALFPSAPVEGRIIYATTQLSTRDDV